jgi:LysR family glycine cleavage system transcriptional activator
MALRIPHMQALRALEATAREQSLTRAAASLSLTHGAVSHQIKALEQELGVNLVERAGRGIRLTDEGERFAQRIRAALAEITAAVQEVTDRSNPRLLRVGCTPSFAARWLLPRMPRFAAAHPDIDLDVRANMSLIDFTRDDTDCAVRYGLGNWTGVESERLVDEYFVAVCSPRIAGGVPRRPADLLRYTLLRSGDESWQPWFAAAGLAWSEPSRGPIFNDSAHMIQAAIEGHGVALGRTSLLGDDVNNGLLVRLFGIEVRSERTYYFVYPPRLAQAPKIALFRRWLKGEVNRTAKRSSRRSTQRRR